MHVYNGIPRDLLDRERAEVLVSGWEVRYRLSGNFYDTFWNIRIVDKPRRVENPRVVVRVTIDNDTVTIEPVGNVTRFNLYHIDDLVHWFAKIMELRLPRGRVLLWPGVKGPFIEIGVGFEPEDMKEGNPVVVCLIGVIAKVDVDRLEPLFMSNREVSPCYDPEVARAESKRVRAYVRLAKTTREPGLLIANLDMFEIWPSKRRWTECKPRPYAPSMTLRRETLKTLVEKHAVFVIIIDSAIPGWYSYDYFINMLEIGAKAARRIYMLLRQRQTA